MIIKLAYYTLLKDYITFNPTLPPLKIRGGRVRL
jgi:hypothetical protein